VVRRVLVPCAIFIPLGLAWTLGLAILMSVGPVQASFKRIQRGAVQDPGCGAWFDVDVAEVTPEFIETWWTPLRVISVDGKTIQGIRINDVYTREVLKLPIIERPFEPLPLAPNTERVRDSFGSPFLCLSRVMERDVTKGGRMISSDFRPAHLGRVAFEMPTRVHPLGLAGDALIAAAQMAVVWYLSVYAFRLSRRLIREHRKQCVACGYPRDPEFGPEVRCPECGAVPRPKRVRRAPTPTVEGAAAGSAFPSPDRA
jgi:hypothetical protein